MLVATFIDHARLTRGWLQLLTSEPIPDIETTAAAPAAATEQSTLTDEAGV